MVLLQLTSFSLPLALLLAVSAASSSSASPHSHLLRVHEGSAHLHDGGGIVYLDYEEDESVPRQRLVKRAPIPPFDPLSKTLLLKKKLLKKKLLKKKLLKKAPKLIVPGGLGAFGLGFAATQGLPALSLPAIPALGGPAAAAAALPFLPPLPAFPAFGGGGNTFPALGGGNNNGRERLPENTGNLLTDLINIERNFFGI